MTNQVELQQLTCIVCDGLIDMDDHVELNELVECMDCGAELEVTSLSPLTLVELDLEGEDWGQ